MLARAEMFIKQFKNTTAVGQAGENIGPGRQERRIVRLAQRLLVVLQRRDVGSRPSATSHWAGWYDPSRTSGH